MKVDDVAGAEVDCLIQGNCSYPKSTSLVTKFSDHAGAQHKTTLLNIQKSVLDIAGQHQNTLNNFEGFDYTKTACSTSNSLLKITRSIVS